MAYTFFYTKGPANSELMVGRFQRVRLLPRQPPVAIRDDVILMNHFVKWDLEILRIQSYFLRINNFLHLKNI